MTVKRADLKMELTNGRAANREPGVAFSHFRALSCSHLSLRCLRKRHLFIVIIITLFTALKTHELRQVPSKTNYFVAALTWVCKTLKCVRLQL